MNKVANRQVICEVLCEEAKKDKDIVVLCSDSRGSASLAAFAQGYPAQFVEAGIAEQNLVGIAAGLARNGKKSYAASPACFLSARSLEQAKVDAAYSDTNVKLIGISGGVSYGALGMSHHSAQDIAGMAAIPNMRVYLPSDRHQTACLVRALLKDRKPAYIRVGRNAVKDVYEEGSVPFLMDRANVLRQPGALGNAAGQGESDNAGESGGSGRRVLIVACGEMVRNAVDAAVCLERENISTAVIDMYCVKPLDTATLINEAEKAEVVITVEEHSLYGGLGSMVSQAVSAHCPRKVINLSLPDSPVVSGTSTEVFDYYGLDAGGIANAVRAALGG